MKAYAVGTNHVALEVGNIHEALKFYSDFLNFEVHEKNKVWCTDFTYMRQPNGKFRYNCSIIDLFDRSAVASLNSN